jgi:hypothetical protein
VVVRRTEQCYNATMPEQMDNYINSFAPELQAIIRTLREVARKSMPETHEMIYHAAIGYSFTQSPFDRICYIAPQNNYVNFGFFFGANLPDPQHVLVGEGKRMRHTKVRSIADATNPALEQLMKEAPNSIAKLHSRK